MKTDHPICVIAQILGLLAGAFGAGLLFLYFGPECDGTLAEWLDISVPAASLILGLLLILAMFLIGCWRERDRPAPGRLPASPPAGPRPGFSVEPVPTRPFSSPRLDGLLPHGRGATQSTWRALERPAGAGENPRARLLPLT